jgi:hypothetical protein
MKVWVVYPDYGPEGYGKPEGVFSSHEIAKCYAASDDRAGTLFEIQEHEIDQPRGFVFE